MFLLEATDDTLGWLGWDVPGHTSELFIVASLGRADGLKRRAGRWKRMVLVAGRRCLVFIALACWGLENESNGNVG